METIKLARWCLDQDFVPIPMIGKAPRTLNWQRTTREKALNQVINFTNKNKNVGIGILTGRISNIIVLDIDDVTKWNQIVKGKEFSTMKVASSRGFHLYFNYNSRLTSNRNNIRNSNIDLRSNGGVIVAPWNEGYEIVNYDEDLIVKIYDMPEWLITFCQS